VRGSAVSAESCGLGAHGERASLRLRDETVPGTQDINPTAIALNRAGTAALVVNSTFPDSPARGGVSVLDTRSLEVRRVIRLGTEPVGLGLDKRRGNTYVTNYLDDTVSWFRTPR
jgi:DNA-binding beta-propeller fold protein YncE